MKIGNPVNLSNFYCRMNGVYISDIIITRLMRELCLLLANDMLYIKNKIVETL